MSETKSNPTFANLPDEVSPEDLKQFMAAHPELFPGLLGESATRLVGAEIDTSTAMAVEPIAAEILESEVIKDQEGWERLLIDTPADGIKVVFKGRHDLPGLETLGDGRVFVSIRPPYHDEPRDHTGALKSEQQVTYAGAHGGDPRLLLRRDGAHQLMNRALEKAEGREVVLICDQTPQGLRTLFQALLGIVGVDELSDTAKKLCAVEYGLSPEPNQEAMSLFSELATELTAALTSEDLSPQEAFALVYGAHVGSPESRKASSEKLSQIITDRLKKDYFGDEEPEVKTAKKQELIEAVEDPERNDFYVHRDKGILRPGDLVLSGGSYFDYPRYTTHGCLNTAIDVEKNVFGSGGHGVAGESGSTTIASPFGEFIKLNGMPVNLEAADTYFINHQGLVIPKGSLFVTVSPESVPSDRSESEVWLPLKITDEDIKNGALDRIVDQLNSSIYSAALSEDEKQGLRYTVERVINEVDNSFQVQSLASSLIAQGEIENIMKTKNLRYEDAKEEYFRRIRSRPGYQFEELVMVDGKNIRDFNFDERAKQDAVKAALDRIMAEFNVSISGSEFSVTPSGDLLMPSDLSENMLGKEALTNVIGQISQTSAFKKLPPAMQADFINRLSTFYGELPTDDMLAEKHESGYGYKHDWGYEVGRQTDPILSEQLSILVTKEHGLDENSWDYNNKLWEKLSELRDQAKSSHLWVEGEPFNVDAAVMAIHYGGSKEEVSARYNKILEDAYKISAGRVRAERLKDWVTYNVINQEEFVALHQEILESSLAEARAQRRSDYLQVWVTNSFISKTRGKPTPKLESFGRGLDWDVPGATEQIKQDYALAERVGIETERHADSYKSNNESRINSALAEIKDSILKNPKQANYSKIIDFLKGLPLGIATMYVRAGIISFDQTHYLDDGPRSRRGL